ncbi:hypothetical protein pipiens_009988 [Culex pipiens pipiens]|uniref:Uncharacterized protein n=1 Tax=Culex pipiens pipiens TaxID=38569 RepID=A0ABD1DC61_CULPP
MQTDEAESEADSAEDTTAGKKRPARPKPQKKSKRLSGSKSKSGSSNEAFSDGQLLRNDEPELDPANRKIWISSKELKEGGNGALKGQPEAETTSDIVAEVPVEAPQVAMASPTTSVSELDLNGSQATQNLNDLGKEAFSRTIWEQKEVPKLLQLTPSGRTATALKQNMDEHFIVRLPVDDSKKLQDWKLNQLDSNIIVECLGNTTTESPTVTLAVEPISEKGDKDKLELPDVVGAGVDGIWIGAQRFQQTVRKGQVEESWKAFSFSPRRRKTSNPEPDVFRIPLKRMDKWKNMHTTAELWIHLRVEHLAILQSRVVGADDEVVPGLEEIHSEEEAVTCGGWCSTSARSWRYKRIEAVVPQGGGVCFGGQPYRRHDKTLGGKTFTKCVPRRAP